MTFECEAASSHSTSSNPLWISAPSSFTASSASVPSAVTMSFAPWPAASIMSPMMLLPFTCSSSFSTQMLLAYLLARFTNCAAGRACIPSLLLMVNSWVQVLMRQRWRRVGFGRGSRTLLIRHLFQEPLVKFGGRVVPEAAQLVVQRRDFDETGDVPAGHDRHL